MRVQARFFAAYRELTGASRAEVDLPEGATVADLIDTLRGRGPSFGVLPPRPAVAVNLEYAPPETELSDGDEVAFIPPVAGG
ncbi:MAG: molybdopterin converting factor subunit 1 [Gammaproteobacteria bacterium]|nr:molybdopterin converting factor subunit 1 [Gammaproteobacteria bacterium]MDE0259581.1 molybdopterin converting factor subunit 1 [Gammaproteobacteria bacterium]